jgi:predicted nucleic-acid-binding protein
MFQLSICVSDLAKNFLEENKKFFKEKSSSFGGIFSTYERGDFAYFLFVGTLKKDELIKDIKHFIVSALIFQYKKKFIESKLVYNYPKDIKYYTLLQALINFDRDNDESFILSKINFETEEFYINSFFNFECGLLKQKWAQLVEITNQNAKFFNVDENYLDILRFLIEGINVRRGIAVEFLQSKFVIKSQNSIISECSTYKEVIDYLIINNPKKIVLKNLDIEFVKFVKNLFLERVTSSSC